MSNDRSIWLIEVYDEPMLTYFDECINKGLSVNDEIIEGLKEKGLNPNKYLENGKIKIWRYTYNIYKDVSEDDIILFYVQRSKKIYVALSSSMFEDMYDPSKGRYRLLPCPSISGNFITQLNKATLIKILGIIEDEDKIREIISEIREKGRRVNGEYITAIGYNQVSDEIRKYIEDRFLEKITDNKKYYECNNLMQYLNLQGYHFPEHIIAQFYVGLKTKGFVILSGLSGTGKTKIALEFAKLLERKFLRSKEIERLEEFMTSSGRNFKAEEEIKALKETRDNNGFAVKYFDYKGELAKSEPPVVLWIYNAIGRTKTQKKVVMGLLITDIKEYSYDTLPEDWKNGLQWIQEVYGTDLKRELEDRKLCVKIEDIWEVNVEISEFKDAKDGKNLSPREDASRMGKGFIRVKSPEGLIPIERNYIFLSVRPDWRDSKPLLGYYNPLDKKYYKTPLLELILKAERDYRENKERALPYFIIIDEMNLARVEYYFAEFLSVLESGRDDDGFTRESIKLHNVDEVERLQGIPKEIRLPPNLYIIGTVNIDETTYMFSPKVLDRAFVIEFHDVDMDGYPPSNEIQNIDYSNLRNRILEDLRGKDGKFLVYSDKEKINEAINELKAKGYWTILQELNRALEPFDLHFGYRVIDEIALFFKNAKGSMDKGIVHFESDDEIFDLALLMKILPKFHGNKRKLEEPLKNILRVCLIENSNINIAELNHDKIVGILRDWENKSREFRFKHTAKKVLRMLRQLYDVGFASFS